MNDRDCENCAHHTGGSCSVWECSFERKENDMIYRQDTIDAMEGVDWYHINKGGQLTHGANSREDEPLYKAKDVYKVLNDMPSAQPDSCNGCKWENAFGYGECDHCKRRHDDMYEVKDDE